MKISIAICTFNGAQFLAEQLHSILTQTRQPDELVICDDRSADQTPQIIESFAARSPFRVHFHVNDRPLGSTKNFEQAVSLCQGDLIFFSDQDDVWMPQKLEQLETALRDEKAGLAFCDGEVVDEQLQPLGKTVWEALHFDARERARFEAGEAFDVLLEHNVATGAALAFRAEFRDLILPIPDDLTHDGVKVLHDWWAALLIAARARLAIVPAQLFKYRQHGSQQLGVLSGNIEPDVKARGFLPRARRKNSFASEIRYLESIRERLLTGAAEAVNKELLHRLEQRLAHLRARDGMPASKLLRVPDVLRELLNLRYHHYSNGLSSAIKDLLI